MAVTRDATGAGGSGTTGTATASHTIGTAGATTVVFAFVAISVSTSSTSTTCSVTYGGTAMTQLNFTLLGSGTARSAYGIYYLFNPASGAQSCVATPAGTATRAQILVSTVSYTGVESGAPSLQSNATLTISATSATNGYNIFGHINGAALSSPSQSQRYTGGSTAVGGVGDILLVQDAAGTGSNITFSVSGTSTTPSTFGVALNAYVAGVQFDAIGAAGDSTTSPISWTHTASGANRAVVVTAVWRGAVGATFTSMTATYGGVAMTQLASVSASSTVMQLCLFGMLDPPVGAQTVSVTLTSTGTISRFHGNSASYTTVDSFGTAVTASGGATPATSSVTAAAGDRIVHSFGAASGSTGTYNQIQRWRSAGATFIDAILGDAAGSGSSTAFTTTVLANWASAAVPLVQWTPPAGSAPYFMGEGVNVSAASSTAVNVPVPGGVVAGSGIVVAIAVAYDPGSACTVTGLPSGFAELTGSPSANSTSGQLAHLHVLGKIATAADTGTYNFTLSATVYRIAFAARYERCDSGGLFDTGTGSNDSSLSATFSNLSLTTANANELLIWAANSWGGLDITGPTGFTQDNEFLAGGPSLYIGSKAQAAAGATGTLNGTMPAGGSRCSWLGALKPATAAAPTVIPGRGINEAPISVHISIR